MRRRRYERRQEMLQRCGGKCVKCNEDDWRVLQIDHVNGGGFKERRARKPGSGMLTTARVEEIVTRVAQGELQVLCANCNWRKRFENNETLAIGHRFVVKR